MAFYSYHNYGFYYLISASCFIIFSDFVYLKLTQYKIEQPLYIHK